MQNIRLCGQVCFQYIFFVWTEVFGSTIVIHINAQLIALYSRILANSYHFILIVYPESEWVSEHGLTSPPTPYRLYGRCKHRKICFSLSTMQAHVTVTYTRSSQASGVTGAANSDWPTDRYPVTVTRVNDRQTGDTTAHARRRLRRHFTTSAVSNKHNRGNETAAVAGRSSTVLSL